MGSKGILVSMIYLKCVGTLAKFMSQLMFGEDFNNYSRGHKKNIASLYVDAW